VASRELAARRRPSSVDAVMRLGRIATLALGLAAIVRVASQPAAGFDELFDGTLDGWSIEATSLGNFRVEDDLLRVEAPRGWLRSDGVYADFDLDIEFRFLTDDADSGVFFRAVGSEPFSRGWPAQSYQLQMMNPLSEAPFAPLGGLFRHAMPDAPTRFDEAAARRVTLPTGEWQRLEISVEGDEVRARINGTLVLEAEGIGNTSGYIGLQGETGALEFRSVRIRGR